jgi:hypothetical protein
MDEGGDGTFNFLDIDCEMLQAVGEIEGIEEVRTLARKLREMKWAEEYLEWPLRRVILGQVDRYMVQLKDKFDSPCLKKL